MKDESKLQIDENLKAWIKEALDGAVKELTGKGYFDGLLVEAKPAWVFPERILIGKIRGQGVQTGFYWFICGDLPTDCIDSSVASAPRDAARYFSLKWQMDAARKGESGHELSEYAEDLYELADEPSLWLTGAEDVIRQGSAS